MLERDEKRWCGELVLGMSRIDPHTHSLHSDGLTSLQVAREKALKRNLHAFAVTDHDMPAIGAVDDDTCPLVIPGIEVSSSDGHVLGIFDRKVDGISHVS